MLKTAELRNIFVEIVKHFISRFFKGSFHLWKDECVFKMGKKCEIIFEFGAF